MGSVRRLLVLRSLRSRFWLGCAFRWICIWVVFVVFSVLTRVYICCARWSIVVFVRFCWFVLSELLSVGFGVRWIGGLVFRSFCVMKFVVIIGLGSGVGVIIISVFSFGVLRRRWFGISSVSIIFFGCG